MTVSTFEVRGHRVRTRSARRYAVVAVRERDTFVVRESRPYGAVFFRSDERACAAAKADEIRAAKDEEIEVVTYLAYAEIVKRTDSVATARREALKHGRAGGPTVVVVDTTTGEEI